MCLATVFIEDDGQKEQVMQDVTWIRLTDDGLQLTTLLGESRLLQAQIERIDLMDSVIVLKKMTSGSSEGMPVDEGDRLV